MRASDRLIVASVVAVFLATFTLTPLTSDGGFLGIGWLLIALLAGVALGLRRLRFGAGSVLLVQLVILAGFLFALSTSMPSATDEPWFAQYVLLWQQGIEHMQTQAAPMDPDDGITVILVSAIGVIMIVTDLLVSGLARPIWGIAPPLTLFLVPAIGLGTDTGVVSFLAIAVGYLGILIAQGLNSTARWTRGLSRDSGAGPGAVGAVVWRSAALIGAPALVGTLILGVALPTLVLPGFGFGNGPGGGRAAAADRPDTGSAPQSESTERRRRDPVPNRSARRYVSADGIAARAERLGLAQRTDAAVQRRHAPGRPRPGRRTE